MANLDNSADSGVYTVSVNLGESEPADQNGKRSENTDVVVVSTQTEDVKLSCASRLKQCCRKYFFEGQKLNGNQEAAASLPEDARWYRKVTVNHRRAVGSLGPAILVISAWAAVMASHDYWHLFPEKYIMSITMIFGSLIAGMTSEGGGAVAFPVMTLALGIKPTIARDFSLAIQSVGMTAATFTIFYMRVLLEWHALTVCTLGGAFGIIIGFHFIDPYITPAGKKLGFVSIWFSFAFALFLLNWNRKRKTHDKIQNFTIFRIIVLFLAGTFGGMCSSFAGNGIDVCVFSILTLLFRVSEKVATPTSVVLMAVNSILGVFWRQLVLDDIAADTWEYFAVCVPIVVIGAPMGALFGSHFHRLVLASLIYILDTIALITAFVVIKLTPVLIGASVGILIGGFLFFLAVTRIGNKLLEYDLKKIKEKNEAQNAEIRL